MAGALRLRSLAHSLRRICAVCEDSTAFHGSVSQPSSSDPGRISRPTFFSNRQCVSSEARKGKRRQKQTEAPDDSNRVDPESKKEQLLRAAIAQITKQYGKETVMWLGRDTHHHVDVISTGSLNLDLALGVGGLPKGRVVEIYGPEASGKTTLALHVIAEAQKIGRGYCLFVDAEHALDLHFAEGLGVCTKDLLFVQPDEAEQALDTVDTFVRSGTTDVIVVDSVAALVPKAELEGEMGEHHMALQARLMSKALRKLTHSLNSSQTILIFLNQTRAKLNTFGGVPAEVTSGGNALKFYASVRLHIRRKSQLKRGEEAYGNEVIVKVVKNKVAPPFRTAEFDIVFGKGISREGEILQLGAKHGFLGMSGSWYAYEGRNFANGKDNARRYLKEHPDLADTLMMAIKEKVLSTSSESSESGRLDPVKEGLDDVAYDAQEQDLDHLEGTG